MHSDSSNCEMLILSLLFQRHWIYFQCICLTFLIILLQMQEFNQKVLPPPYNETLLFQKGFNNGFDIFNGPLIEPEGDWTIKLLSSRLQNQPTYFTIVRHYLCTDNSCWQPFDPLKMYKQQGGGFTFQQYLEYCQPKKYYCKWCQHCREQQNQKITFLQKQFGQDIKAVFAQTFTYINGDVFAFKQKLKIGLINKYRTIFKDGNSCLLQCWDQKNHYTLFMYMS